jgi:hypothetical protein
MTDFGTRPNLALPTSAHTTCSKINLTVCREVGKLRYVLGQLNVDYLALRAKSVAIFVAVGMRIITPPLATTIFLLFEYNLPSELARQAPAQPTIDD